ncbi:Auxilin-related protein 2 [Ananas comosus]|uniref:Auxilin-related protein 2 n=1 Tax=Ananas comosus TaxID=4615 RepID=A0A199UNM2_ANACO|nr:Auxilin-related protein 2 [Ananas comosus]
MDEFPGLLARDFGFRPQDKSAPMAASKLSSSSSSSASASLRSNPRSGWSQPDPLLGDPAIGPIFDGFGDSGSKSASSLPVFDKPVYDDDIFGGVPGVKSSSVAYDDVFASMMRSGPSHAASAPPYDDLLENLGKGAPETKGGGDRRSEGRKASEFSEFDELIPGFGGSSPPMRKREAPRTNEQKPAVPSAKPSGSMADDPFDVLKTASTSAYSSSGLFADPVQRNVDTSSTTGGGNFDTSNDFDGLSKSVPFFTSEVNNKPKERSPPNNIRDSSPVHNFTRKELFQGSSMDSFENITPDVLSAKFSDSNEYVTTSGVQNSEQLPKSNEHSETEDDVWLTVAEIPLFTQPTSAPPPSRLPPPLRSFDANAKRKENKYFSQTSLRDSYQRDSEKKSGVAPLDELDDFVMVKPQKFAYEEEIEKNSSMAASAAAESTEFTHKERDTHDLEEREKQERLQREKEEREREEQKRLEKEREKRERERARQAVERATREARERAAAEARLRAERAAVQRAAAEARERAAAESRKAAAEARERAAAEARERAAKAEAEAREIAAEEARERTAAEARERAAAERAAVERAAAEARQRAAAEARERAAAGAREKAAGAREKAAAERAAVERAAAEARRRAERAAVERASAEARQRAAAAAREKMQKAENDLESFFGTGFRASSASDTLFNSQAQTRGSSDVSRSTSSGSVPNTRKTSSSTTNIVDDLSSIFGAPPSSGEFQEVEGENEERRRARFERHQRTLERAAKALAEKNERDMQTQREQTERHVLWPECGWQPVSLTDLITAAAVKKVYRKATLCIHPDKVQQKGATLQQKYVAEKVFDLLKEAWNKFNSEELF